MITKIPKQVQNDNDIDLRQFFSVAVMLDLFQYLLLNQL